MSNYPPGVTGNEPHLTGEYGCRVCMGEGGFKDEEDAVACFWCKGTGIEPEEVSASQLWELSCYYSRKEAREYVVCMATDWLNRHDPETRKYLRSCIKAVSDRW